MEMISQPLPVCVSLRLFFGRCLLIWVWSILILQLNINLQVKHNCWFVNDRQVFNLSPPPAFFFPLLKWNVCRLPLFDAVLVKLDCSLQKPEIMCNKGCGGALHL